MGLGEIFKDVVGTFKADPNKTLEFQQAIDANKTAISAKQLELEEKLQDELAAEVNAASANIRADAASGDKYTSRARPSFIYVMLAVLLFNYVALPLMHIEPRMLPDGLYWLFGSCMLGYTGARTWEKLGIMGNGK